MSRYWIAVLLALAAGAVAPRGAPAASPRAPAAVVSASLVEESDDAPPLPSDEFSFSGWPASQSPHTIWRSDTLGAYGAEHQYDEYGVAPWAGEPCEPAYPDPAWQHWFPLRHSSTHGRHIGVGQPLIGTSWRNRPYYVGGDAGMVWLSRPPTDELSRDIDFLGGVFVGCDWDHYWGSELAVRWASPDLNFRDEDGDLHRGGRLTLWTASLLYYPWGDSALRPYWRWGVGATDIAFPTEHGRREETLWTFPVGVGLKYPLRRWLAGRVELTDYIGVGTNGVATQHNLGLTFGLECRFGAHPRSYWPWNPNRHIW